YIYPKDFDSKDKLLKYLDDYNKDKKEADSVQYMDMAEMLSSLSGNIMNAITIVLVAFSAISLIVSSIMIGIITYISVLERTKEIGVLRALGARKRDISRVFNAETTLIGLCSGFLGIGIALLLTIPANIVIEEISGLANVAQLNPVHALILIIISMTLTLIGGFIP
ncbi:MAG: ABC transporter permease, partial [Enterococcus sp.]